MIGIVSFCVHTPGYAFSAQSRLQRNHPHNPQCLGTHIPSFGENCCSRPARKHSETPAALGAISLYTEFTY
jgi:hypothetical protein